MKKAAIGTSFSDEAVLSGHGDPLGEAVRQLRMSIQDKMDDDGIELMQGITPAKGHVLTLSGGAISYEDVIDALHLLEEDNEEQGISASLLANHETIKAIRKSPQFIDVAGVMRDRILTNGAIGTIAGARIIISNKLKDNEAYLLTPQCLTAFMKRDIVVGREYDIVHGKITLLSNCHYLIAIENYNKLVALRWKV